MWTAAVSAITPVMWALLALPSLTAGAKERIQVSDGDVVFSINYYDDGRSFPYVVTFTDFGFKSTYKFDDNGKVSKIIADGDNYTVKYRKNGRVKNVSRAGARRDLAEEVEDGLDNMLEEGVSAPRRRLEACDECTYAWDDICFIGVETVCDLVTYGDPFLAPAETSMDVLCSTLGALCEDLSAGEACSSQCEECLPPFTITLEWSTDADEDPANLNLFVIEPNGNLVYWESPEGDAGFIREFENKEVYTVFPDVSADSVSDILGYYIAFGEWYAGGHPAYWTMKAVTGSEHVAFNTGGEFSGECGSSTSDSPTSESSFGSTLAMTNMLYGELDEYVDNGCGVVSDAVATTTAAKSARPGRG